jgi:ribosomal-protein-alanine N-acetyltransferase
MDNEYKIERAQITDIPAIAALFTDSFKDSVLHHCGRLPKPQAMQDVFSLVYKAEPKAAFVARTAGGNIIGYCFAPTALKCLWVKAVFRGHLLKWFWRWLTGKYGFGLYPVKVIVMNKLSFLRSAFTPNKVADGRILSIAVAGDWRGRGVAGALMTAAVDYFRSVGTRLVRLEVRPDNAPAIRVYHNHKFVDSGFTYDSQGLWLIMFKEVD